MDWITKNLGRGAIISNSEGGTSPSLSFSFVFVSLVSSRELGIFIISRENLPKEISRKITHLKIIRATIGARKFYWDYRQTQFSLKSFFLNLSIRKDWALLVKMNTLPFMYTNFRSCSKIINYSYYQNMSRYNNVFQTNFVFQSFLG